MDPELKTRLKMGFDFVEDDLRESFDEISSDGTDSWLVGVFPPRYRSHVSREMCLMFLGLLQVLRPKILGPNPWLGCRAEELLLAWVADVARDVNEEQTGESVDEVLDDFLEDVYEDTDYKFLYDDRFDGVENIPQLGIGSMSPDGWFKLFRVTKFINSEFEHCGFRIILTHRRSCYMSVVLFQSFELWKLSVQHERFECGGTTRVFGESILSQHLGPKIMRLQPVCNP